MNYQDIFIPRERLKTLTRSELAYYFKKYKNGDINARTFIIENSISIVIHRILTRFKKTPYDRSELVSIGLVGLIKSVDTFDISKNFQFTTYASVCIDNEILMFIRKGKSRIKCDSLDKPIQTNSSHQKKMTLADTISIPDFVEEVETKELYKILGEIIDTLPEPKKTITKLYFGFSSNPSLTQVEIAKKLGLSQSHISKTIKKTINILRLELQNIEYLEKSPEKIIKKLK